MNLQGEDTVAPPIVSDYPALAADERVPAVKPDAAAAPRAGFSRDQKRYLADVLVQLHRQVRPNGESAQSAEPASFWNTPVEDLCKEERAKLETHVLDIWDQIVQHNNANRIAEGITQFMFRHHGLFNVEPNSPGYMCRLRLPSCKLRGDQLIGLADIAQNIAGGYAHVTTRGNLQLREIAPDRALDLLAGLYDIGLSCKGSGADSVRNITASPTAGFDRSELTDLHHLGIQLGHRILNTRDLHGIPRKFNIAFDNAGSVSVVSDTNDVGYLAVRIQENDQQVEPGIHCRILFGGITGHEDFARDTGVICRPEDTPEISEAVLRVFLEHGDRSNRKKARFKYVLDKHGFDWTLDRVQEKLDEFGNGVRLTRLSAEFDAPRPAIDRQAHIGVHRQSQQGLYYVGVALRLGHLSPDQMRRLGKLAMRFGGNDIRLTVWQNLIIPHVPDSDLQAVLAEIRDMGLDTEASSFSAGAVACTGRSGCKLANAHTKENAASIIDHLEAYYTLDQPMNIHVTGCPNSCAQHYIGDIGLIGTTASDGSEGYNLFVGGGSDQDQGLARSLCGPVPARDIEQLTGDIIGNYLEKRQEKESFLDFTRRLDSEEALQDALLPTQP